MVRISDKALRRFKSEVRRHTFRVRRIPGRALVLELNTYIRGWGGYYARADGAQKQLEELDRWTRKRVRQWTWVSWKTRANRLRQLTKGGVSLIPALAAVGTRSVWRAAGGRSLGICLSNARLRKAGLIPLLDLWQRFALL
jgi:hypothetical protein